jgi:aryl-alcohol dehydrogenase-like predicted oxidoreductase
MRKVLLGKDGPLVGVIGLGCMGMSWGYSESTNDENESISTIHEAIELGVELFDTADVYGDGRNETLVGRALSGRRDQVVLATKCGHVLDDLATKRMHRDGSPEHIRAAVRASLSRLGTDVIDLYYLHRVDDNVPHAESWGTMSELVAAGLVPVDRVVGGHGRAGGAGACAAPGRRDPVGVVPMVPRSLGNRTRRRLGRLVQTSGRCLCPFLAARPGFS